jgi:glutaredoxin 3|tara:strand:- start:204 stop:434 length:231 start_codon:yes stop_codon:yes gene_type:complete
MKVVMITGQFCGYCEAAKHLLSVRGVEYKEISAHEDEGMKIMTEHNLKTVPQIFINDELIGGYNDLQKWALRDAGD